MISYGVLVAVVIANLLMTTWLWGKFKRPKFKKDFLKQLWDDKPIIPKHQQPKSLGDERFKVCVNETDERFFADFADFGNVVNRWLAPLTCHGASRNCPRPS